MITVGIHQDLVLNKATKNDQGTLVIGVKEAGTIDPLAALSATGTTKFEGETKDFLIYPPKTTNFDGQPDTYQNNLKKIGDIKDQLEHILKAYMSTQMIKWDPLVGTGVTNDNMAAKLTSETVLTQVYNNVVDQFLKMIKPFVSDSGKKMRMLFIRQSKAKHYPALRKKFLDSYPFIEPMDIPAASSKLKYSAYEIKENLHTGDAIAAPATSAADANAANDIFATTPA